MVDAHLALDSGQPPGVPETAEKLTDVTPGFVVPDPPEGWLFGSRVDHTEQERASKPRKPGGQMILYAILAIIFVVLLFAYVPRSAAGV